VNVIHPSAIDALHRMDEVRKAREDRMRNALEILSELVVGHYENSPRLGRYVRRVAREGLGRETE
jgi:hypothetical protein